MSAPLQLSDGRNESIYYRKLAKPGFSTKLGNQTHFFAITHVHGPLPKQKTSLRKETIRNLSLIQQEHLPMASTKLGKRDQR